MAPDLPARSFLGGADSWWSIVPGCALGVSAGIVLGIDADVLSKPDAAELAMAVGRIAGVSTCVVSGAVSLVSGKPSLAIVATVSASVSAGVIHTVENPVTWKALGKSKKVIVFMAHLFSLVLIRPFIKLCASTSRRRHCPRVQPKPLADVEGYKRGEGSRGVGSGGRGGGGSRATGGGRDGKRWMTTWRRPLKWHVL